jgi:high affinity Mn2+ porin
MTSTLYLGTRLWNGASAFINPEIAGGSGLSGALGVAASTNGETFRIGDPAPKIYLARLFFTQVFALSDKSTYQASDFNQLAGSLPENYLAFTLGQVSISDFFDDNKFSHDPRTQFMSWGLMSNGAWDYPANTRGYTPSIVLEYVNQKDELRYGFSLIPTTANGNVMNWNIANAGSHTLEYTRRYSLAERNGTIRLLGFFTTGSMGNYFQAISSNPLNPDIHSVEKYGNTKYGFALNAEQDFSKSLGGFFRASWNDGQNETWAFTEIDKSISAGLNLAGNAWKRQNDNLGLAFVVSGISDAHQAYLKAGGKGFMLGDGNLNYGLEQLAELYYNFQLTRNISFSGTYQLVINPGYNIDRKGPVNVFSARLHIKI